MGYGVVGSGVVEVFYKNREKIQKRAGQEMDIKYILDLRDFPDSPYQNKFTKNFEDILNDSEVKIVVEVMGGVNPAFDFVKRCLEAGKSVATSNKELVATHGAELLKIAVDNNVNFLFEASVGGGIPIIRPLTQCLAANDIIEIDGILNGTTNYILTKMICEKASFSDALKKAQQLGYAERDPSADIEGADACRKVCILASLAYGKHVYPSQVYTEGITDITLEDVEYAESYNAVIKLIGRTATVQGGKISATVYPCFVKKSSPLANVEDVFNAILVRGDAIGDAVFYGRGAGKLPTASAVVADIIDCVKHLKTRKVLSWEDGEENYVQSYTENEVAKYFRVVSSDIDALKSTLCELFGSVQYLCRKNEPSDEIAFVSPVMKEKELIAAAEKISKTANIIASIRISNV
jgi:homoserine dehydrogenase